MKSVLLFSSIFYLLGLKIGHKIDLFKNSHPTEKKTTTSDPVKQSVKSINFNDGVQLKCDTLLFKNSAETDKIKNVETHL